MGAHSLLDKPATAQRIIGWLVEGKSHADVAKLLQTKRIKTSRQAVTAFAHRHKAELGSLEARVVEAVADVTIADLSMQLRELGDLFERQKQIVETRGLMAAETKHIGGPLFGREIVVERFDAPLVREIRGTLKDAADLMGLLTKNAPAGGDDNRQVHVYNFDGFTDDEKRAIMLLGLRKLGTREGE